jgi:hypothetical protein
VVDAFFVERLEIEFHFRSSCLVDLSVLVGCRSGLLASEVRLPLQVNPLFTLNLLGNWNGAVFDYIIHAFLLCCAVHLLALITMFNHAGHVRTQQALVFVDS